MTSDSQLALVTEATGLRGSTIYAAHLARRLARRGRRVVLSAPRDPFLAGAVGPDVEIVAPEGMWALTGAFDPKALARPLAHRKLSLLHVLTLRHLRSWQRFAGRMNVPIVVSATSFLRRPLKYASHQQPRPLFVAISEDIRQNLVNVGKIPKELVRLVTCGVDSPPPSDHGPPPSNDLKVLAAMGALDEGKGLDILLAAARDLVHRGLEFQLFIIGSGPLEKRMRALRTQLDLNRQVIFAPATPAYGQLLDNIDIFVLPAIAQPLGQILLEAMARGKPVVASGVGGVYGVLTDREDGLIVKSGDVEELTDALARLLQDDQMRASLGAAARRCVARRFRMETMIDRTLDVHREALGAE